MRGDGRAKLLLSRIPATSTAPISAAPQKNAGNGSQRGPEFRGPAGASPWDGETAAHEERFLITEDTESKAKLRVFSSVGDRIGGEYSARFRDVFFRVAI
jgi:hypothetical protein